MIKKQQTHFQLINRPIARTSMENIRNPMDEKIQQPKIQQEAPSMPQKKPFLHGIGKIINGFFTVVLVPGYAFFLFFGVFVKITLFHKEHFALNLSLLFFAAFMLTTVFLAIYNDHFKIPRLKKKALNLPTVGIQIIGRGETYDDFFAVMNNMRNVKYPPHLIKRMILALDGKDNKNDDMKRVFLQLFPGSIKIQLDKHFSTYTQQQRKQLLEKYSDKKYIIVSQPHGGRRQIKFTAFQFSSDGTEYVYHSDSDTIVSLNALETMAHTAAGYNTQNPNLKPCGGIVGEIKIINVFNYFVFHMEISYWYAFNAGRSSQSAVNCVSTVSGAMGLFNSKAMRLILDDYANQHFLCGKIKCVFGQDRHLTTGLIINGHAVLYDREALALTECPKSVHNLIIQQTRWYKGFYRQNLVYLPKIFYFSVWTNLTIIVSFCLPLLTLLHIFYSQISGINKLSFFSLFVFGMGAITSLRGIGRNHKIRYIHCVWHPLFYYLFLMPCKMLAMSDLLFQDNKKCCESRCMKVCHVYIWLVLGSGVVVGYGFLYNILVGQQKIIVWLAFGLIIILAILLLLLVHWVTWGLGYYVPNNIQKHARIYEKARSLGFEELGQTVKVIIADNIDNICQQQKDSIQSARSPSTAITVPKLSVI